MTEMTAPSPARQWMRRIRRMHLVGIGGSGMSGIAEVLLNLGFEVSGSDVRDSATVRRLQRLGVTVAIGHDAAHVSGADVVVTSTAIGADNPEVKAAQQGRIPVVPRAEMLAELMRFQQGVAVAGTHGKTTATSLIASVLAEGGLDPTFVIGGRLNSAGSNARLGTGSYLVAEADESDGSFLYLKPIVTVITNIDADHLETYGGDFEQLRGTFTQFLHHLPFYGLAVLCVDDPVVADLVPETSRPVLTYGIDADAAVRASGVRADGARSRFEVLLPDEPTPLEITLNLPGRHNIRNALAAIAVGHELGVASGTIRRALEQFEGIDRRFQVYGDVPIAGGTITLVDDYGHHPAEIEATVQAAREAWPGRRVVVAFQPHRYSRTRDLLEDFARVLSTLERLVLCEVYPAGEAPLVGADGRALARAVRAHGRVDPVFVPRLGELAAALRGVLADGDVVLTLGAGDIGSAAAELATALVEGEA